MCNFTRSLLASVCPQRLDVHMLSLQVLLRTTVFARMTPDQKTQLVKELQKLKWVLEEKGREVIPIHAARSSLPRILDS